MADAATKDALVSVSEDEASALAANAEEREKSKMLARKILLREKESRMELESQYLREEEEERRVCLYVVFTPYCRLV